MAGVIDLLEQEARRLNFFGAVSLIEDYFKESGIPDPLNSGAVQFESDPSIAFPASDIVSIRRHDDRIVLRLSFMGLAGVSSPLPSYFCDYIVRREAEADALLDFLTVFNNRLYAFFYRAWKKYHLTSIASYDPGNPLLRCVGALAGVPLTMELPGSSFRTLAYAGLFAGMPRSHAALEALLSDFFDGIPVRVTEFMPRWAPLPDPSVLGANDNARLGVTAILGTSLYERSGKFLVTLGPLAAGMFESFLPQGANHAAVKTLIDSFLAEPLDYDLEVLLESRDLTPVTLGDGAARLGQTAALGETTGVSDITSMALEGRSFGG
ncbi:MAG: type VI secretion system baseplate subunit TssG [Chitinispirillaceae bacterium]|nr:type VI secretion system baseplate subunit TssG [Chitinispirillaceae bacterium]